MAKKYELPPDMWRRVHDALLAQVPYDPPVKDGYVVLSECPVPAVANALGLAEGTARNYLGALGKKYYRPVRLNKKRYWLVRMPELRIAGEPTVPNADEEQVASAEVVLPGWFDDFAEGCEHMAQVPQLLRGVFEEVANLRLTVRQQAAEITTVTGERDAALGQLQALRTDYDRLSRRVEGARSALENGTD